MDKIVKSPAVRYRELADRTDGESSVAIAERVLVARQIQLERFKGTNVHCNTHLTHGTFGNMRAGRGRASPAGSGDRSAGSFRPRLHEDFKSGVDNRRPRCFRTRRRAASGGSDPVPEPGQEGALIYRQHHASRLCRLNSHGSDKARNNRLDCFPLFHVWLHQFFQSLAALTLRPQLAQSAWPITVNIPSRLAPP